MKNKNRNLKKHFLISGIGGIILGILGVVIFFTLFSASFPQWLIKILLFPFILIPSTLSENYCELIDVHTFGCFGSSAIIFSFLYNFLLFTILYIIIYLIRRWVKSREKKNKAVTFFTLILFIGLLIVGVLTFIMVYFGGWIEPDMCDKRFLEDYETALKEKNVSFCQEFRNKNYNTEVTRHSCYLKLPKETEYGENYLLTEEDCFNDFANATQNISLCEKVYVGGCDTCFYFCIKNIRELSDNPEMCDALSTNFFKKECYDHVINHYYEFEICDRVANEFFNLCEEHIQQNRQIPYFKKEYRQFSPEELRALSIPDKSKEFVNYIEDAISIDVRRDYTLYNRNYKGDLDYDFIVISAKPDNFIVRINDETIKNLTVNKSTSLPYGTEFGITSVFERNDKIYVAFYFGND